MRKELALIIVVTLMPLVVMGCEIDREFFEELIGVSLPWEGSLGMGADGIGTMTFRMGGEDQEEAEGEQIPVQYKDGRIWGSGEGFSFDADITKEDGKYLMKGTLTLIGPIPFKKPIW